MRPLAVVGSLSRDVVDGAARIGGAPYYAARALRLAGVPGRIATRCAPADRGLLRELVRLGVPVTWSEGARTAGFEHRYDGDARAATVTSIADPWTPADVRGWARPALDHADWVHAAPLVRSDFPAETVAALARSARVSFDGQGLVRPAVTGPVRLDADYDPAVLRHVTILKLAEEEASALGALDEAGLRALGPPEVVVTLGGRGSLVFWRGRLDRVPARTIEGVDPTGAGDGFAVGYLAARAGGHAPPAAARRASLLVSALLSGRAR